LLREYGEVTAVSSVWESQAVGSEGPDFLNLSVQFEASMDRGELKTHVVDVIERALGRSRTSDKNAPRTIDIDVIWEDGAPVNTELWNHPFVILPMAELEPELRHPITGRPLKDEAPRAAAALWIRRRPEASSPTA
jgi:2-amino-4-hydroxy-6-hydroxymethyldihydropteridine diphosphokinase